MRLDVVIINWNGHVDTTECLGSILRADQPLEVRVIVIDNASSDDSVNRITAWANAENVPVRVIDAEPSIQAESSSTDARISLVLSETNRGFCEANNLGAEMAFSEGSDFALILNNDTVVPADFFTALVPAMESDDGRTVYSPQISYYPDTGTTWWSGGTFSSILSPAYTEQGLPLTRKEGTKGTDWVSGCATLVSRPVFETLGLYDPVFFIWCEEWDLSLRARASGYTLAVVNGAVVGHKVGRSLGIVSPLTFFYSMRNMLILRRRHLPRHVAVAHTIAYVPLKALQAIRFAASKREIAYLQAWFDAVRSRHVGGIWRYQQAS